MSGVYASKIVGACIADGWRIWRRVIVALSRCSKRNLKKEPSDWRMWEIWKILRYSRTLMSWAWQLQVSYVAFASNLSSDTQLCLEKDCATISNYGWSGHDIMNYQCRSLSYLPNPVALLVISCENRIQWLFLLYIIKQSAKEKRKIPSEFAIVWER